MSTEWKNKPIEQALKGMKCVPHLKAAGFKTAGDVIDLTAEEVAKITRRVGVIRANKIRNIILQDALKDATVPPLFQSKPVECVEVKGRGVELPISYQIILFIAFGLSVASFIGLLFEVTK